MLRKKVDFPHPQLQQCWGTELKIFKVEETSYLKISFSSPRTVMLMLLAYQCVIIILESHTAFIPSLNIRARAKTSHIPALPGAPSGAARAARPRLPQLTPLGTCSAELHPGWAGLTSSYPLRKDGLETLPPASAPLGPKSREKLCHRDREWNGAQG